MRVFAGDTADREGVAAVRRDVDLDGRIVETEQADRIRAHLRVEPEGGQTQDAVVLVTETELTNRGNHAVRQVTVGLASRNRERAGEH